MRNAALLCAMHSAPFVLASRTLVAQVPNRAPVAATANNKGRMLTGTVVDVVGKPMEGSDVYIAGTDRSVRTDARGRWQFEEPPIGPRVLVARQIGFIPYVRDLEIATHLSDCACSESGSNSVTATAMI